MVGYRCIKAGRDIQTGFGCSMKLKNRQQRVQHTSRPMTATQLTLLVSPSFWRIDPGRFFLLVILCDDQIVTIMKL